MYYTELSHSKQLQLAKNAELACRLALKQLGVKLKMLCMALHGLANGKTF